MSPRIALGLFTLLFSFGRLPAQEINENSFIRYARQEGLSSDNITSLAQDSTGYIWVSTTFGLNRYDGSRFVQFHNTDDSLSLPAEDIKGLTWLGHCRLAVRTEIGLHMIHTADGASRNIFIPYKDKKFQYKFNNIMSVKAWRGDDMIVLTRPGIYHYDKNYRLVHRYDHYKDNEVTTPLTFGIGLLELDTHRFIITSFLGFFIYDALKHEVKKMETADCPILAEYLNRSQSKVFQLKRGCFLVFPEHSDSLVYIDVAANKKKYSRLPLFPYRNEMIGERSRLLPVNDTLFYFTGHLSGFYKMIFNPATGNATVFPRQYFPSYFCSSLLKDRNNCLWVGTNKGLFRQQESKDHIQQSGLEQAIYTQFPNLAMSKVYGIGDKLYVSSREKGGLLVFDRRNLQFLRRISFEKQSPDANNVYCMVAPDNHTLLIATGGGLLLLDTGTGQVIRKWYREGSYPPVDLYKDKKGDIWVGCHPICKYQVATRTLCIIDTDNTLFSAIQRAQHITGDADGNIWIAGHGLCRYNTASEKFDLLIDSFPSIKMIDRKVNSFVIDQQDNIWFNSNNNGLTGYNIRTRQYSHFTRNDGLPDNNISAMKLLDNKLWMASYSGISCLDLQTRHIFSFGRDDGFPDLPIMPGSSFFYDTVQKKLCIGFSRMLVRFDPEIAFRKSIVPSFFLEQVAIGDQVKMFLPDDTITTTWDKNDITLTIGSINFLNSSSQRFAYRLPREDSTAWQQLGAQNTFSIANLSPGLHKVQLKLFSVNSRWPEQVREFAIQVLPPFWKTSWFRILLVGLLMLAVYGFFKWRTGLIRKKEQEKTHIQQLKAEEYKTQVTLEQISHYFSSSLTGKKDIGEVLSDVSQNLIGRLGYLDCMIYLWNANRTKMLHKTSFETKGAETPGSIFEALPGEGVVGYVMQTKQPLLIPDIREDERYKAGDFHRRSVACVPIIHNGELLGILNSEHPHLNFYSDKDIRILMTISTLLGNKIKQLESEQSLLIKDEELVTINEQLAEAQLSALQTQMNPHFIFNALNSIKKLILVNDAHNASRYLSKFAHMIRLTLNQSKELFASLHDNIDYLESYLEMEKLRFDNSFTYHIQIDESLEAEEISVPTLMIQPLVENAIWHGLLTIEGEKKLNIRFSREEDTFKCIIKDNGIGLRQSQKLKQVKRPAHRSVGLDNLRNRIHIINEKYRMNCDLQINDLSDECKDKRGTIAILTFRIID